MQDPELLLLGCGNMGSALAAGFLRQAPASRLLVVDPDLDRARALLPPGTGATVVPTVAEAALSRPGMTILAVKPQQMEFVLPQLAAVPAAEGLVVSIAAGTGTRTLRAALPRARLVRAMPNIPASAGAGATGLWGGVEVTGPDRARCEALFGSVGIACWVDAEADIDSVTAVSGSGPAYFFAAVQALAAAGTALGLSRPVANELARATLTGAAAMLSEADADPVALKAAVRSAQGTTDAALKVFEQDDALEALFSRAVRAAFDRARALSAGPG